MNALTLEKRYIIMPYSCACHTRFLTPGGQANVSLHQTSQTLEMIKRSRNPLICLPRHANADAYASALGMAQVLKKLDKQPVVVTADDEAPQNVCFLDGHKEICTSIENLHELVLELDATTTQPQELSYEVKDGKLRVFVQPKGGAWRAQDARVSTSAFRYDLIVAIGAADLASFGHVFENAPDFFYQTPVINIDHSPDNAHFGHINHVDVTACACGEVCHDLVIAMDETLLDTAIATAFLAGMIAKTKSFKHNHVSPKTLQVASRLMDLGADRETAVQHLYRTRSVETLRLWGRALARLKIDAEHPLVWTLLSQQDFLHAGGREEELPDVIEELIATSPNAKIVALIFENRDKHICAIVRAERPYDAARLCATFDTNKKSADSREEVRLNFAHQEIVRVERDLIETLKHAMAQQAPRARS